jgi:hypothetical protein
MVMAVQAGILFLTLQLQMRLLDVLWLLAEVTVVAQVVVVLLMAVMAALVAVKAAVVVLVLEVLRLLDKEMTAGLILAR